MYPEKEKKDPKVSTLPGLFPTTLEWLVQANNQDYDINIYGKRQEHIWK